MENLSKQEILNRIGYFRAKKNFSAYKLGTLLGHSKNYFYRVENGEISLSLDALLEILQILDVSTSEFFCPFLQETDLKLVQDFNQLSAENKQTILNLINNLK